MNSDLLFTPIRIGNLCFAHGVSWPIDCYNEEIAAQKKAMMEEEADSCPGKT